MKKICVTGADGFIGNSLCEHLIKSNKSIRGLVRNLKPSKGNDKVEYLEIGDLSSNLNLIDYMTGYDCVIHCAGKTHVMNNKNDLDIYRLANSVVTKHLAEQAVQALAHG